MMSYFISVSGIMGSGKTTLAQNLSRRLGWRYLPESRNAVAFLKDLFADPRRWAFDAQVSFFSEKAIQLKNSIRSGASVILDRSLSEDIHVFARHFHESGYFDERSYKTYLEITGYFLEELPALDLMLYCETPYDLALQRMGQRSGSSNFTYPAGHIEHIIDRYTWWLENYDESGVVKVDSSLWDFRRKDVVEEIAIELISVLEGQLVTAEQLDLFETPQPSTDQNTLNVLDIVGGASIIKRPKVKTTKLRNKWGVPPFPFVYIAAPFTGKAVEVKSAIKSQPGVFDNGAPHGRLEPGIYRRSLSKISRAFETFGLNVLLPHRDVNEWGAKSLNSFDVMSLCTTHVVNCDLFFGLLGQSTGAHYEYGIARAQNKPSIIVHCAELTDSFMAEGIERNESTLVLSCERIEDASKLLVSSVVRAFIKRHVTT